MSYKYTVRARSDSKWPDGPENIQNLYIEEMSMQRLIYKNQNIKHGRHSLISGRL